MYDGDWETQHVLREIESYESTAPGNSRVSSRRPPILNAKFQQKLDNLNIEKQMQQNHRKANRNGWETEREEISKKDIANWKEQVLSASRPMNQYSENRQVNVNVSELNNRFNQQHPETSYPTNINYRTNNVETISGDNTVFSANSRKSLRIPVKVNNQISARKTSRSESTDSKYATVQDIYHARPCYIVNIDENIGASSSNQYSNRTGQINGRSIRHSTDSRSVESTAETDIHRNYIKQYDITQQTEAEQRQKYEELVAQVERDMQTNQTLIGICGVCGGELYERSEVVCALEKMFHNGCLICELCGRTLKGKKFYKVGKKFYCEEDYLYTAVHSTAERCTSCMEPIISEALQAFGKAYHPQCFRCYKCNKCLDGIPFAVDDQQRIYCTEDYALLFAPHCIQCRKPIYQNKGDRRVSRLIVDGKNYHQECYVCEGCRCKLTEGGESKCYPLNGHLLCRNCHRIWKRTGGTENVITDL